MRWRPAKLAVLALLVSASSQAQDGSSEADLARQLANLIAALISVQGGLRYYAKSTDTGPEGLGYRLALTLLFPR